MKLLTFAIPCYNSQDYMRHCIESILPGGEDVEILIVDEVLAVGDAAFQEKCQERMHKMLDNGTTLLFVSHTMATVRELCDHAIWLNKGSVIMQGEAEGVCDAYMDSLSLL